MGVLTDLIVAPLSDAAAVATTGSKERPWPWVDVKGLGVEELATIHCLIDGVDPKEPVSPPEWRTNPFTKEKRAVTMFSRYVGGFDMVAGDEEVCAMRLPPVLVARLARLDSATATDLARGWRSMRPAAERHGDGTPAQVLAEYRSCLECVAAMAKEATGRNQELLLWMCP
jgi:hypothetical protein